MTDSEYEKKLKRIDEIFEPKNKQEEDELNRLVAEVEEYEKDLLQM